jgi:hypothetical protein
VSNQWLSQLLASFHSIIVSPPLSLISYPPIPSEALILLHHLIRLAPLDRGLSRLSLNVLEHQIVGSLCEGRGEADNVGLKRVEDGELQVGGLLGLEVGRQVEGQGESQEEGEREEVVQQGEVMGEAWTVKVCGRWVRWAGRLGVELTGVIEEEQEESGGR